LRGGALSERQRLEGGAVERGVGEWVEGLEGAPLGRVTATVEGVEGGLPAAAALALRWATTVSRTVATPSKRATLVAVEEAATGGGRGLTVGREMASIKNVKGE
jgi:hypothetical protein